MREGSPKKRSEQQPGNLVARYLLDTWGHFLATSLDSLGYSSVSHLDRLARGEWVENRHFQSRVPRGALKKGLGEYLLVERVLRKLGEPYRETAAIEYALPLLVVGRTLSRRAAYQGVSRAVYSRRLDKIMAHILADISTPPMPQPATTGAIGPLTHKSEI